VCLCCFGSGNLKNRDDYDRILFFLFLTERGFCWSKLSFIYTPDVIDFGKPTPNRTRGQSFITLPLILLLLPHVPVQRKDSTDAMHLGRIKRGVWWWVLSI
jgi:hypothetical protein